MLMTKERRPAIRMLRGWGINVLKEAHAIHECEHHDWMQDRAGPHARERTIDIARLTPPSGLSPDAAAAEIQEVSDSIGDTCPECSPECRPPHRLFDLTCTRALHVLHRGRMLVHHSD